MENVAKKSAEPNFASLLGGLANDATDLLRQEVALTKLEVQNGLDKAKSAAIGLTIGIGIIAAGAMLVMLMLVHLLAASTVVPLWGCYGIVGGVLVGIGAVALAMGKTKAVELQAVPQRSVARIKESAQWLTKQTISIKR